MFPADFHFERPLWLLALLPVAVLLWYGAQAAMRTSAWQNAVDAHLLRHLALPGESGGQRAPLWLLAAGWLAACLAMAGPSWERMPQPTTKTIEPTVVALDMSVSMDAQDLTPSRLARARYKLQDVLDRNAGGQVGLVIYSDEPFVASPLTDDGRVIAEMIPTLTSDIMPGRGSRPDRAIEQADALLEQAGVPGGRILLFADSAGDDPRATRAAARQAASNGRTVSVLAVGTKDGASIPDGRGGFARTPTGEIFTARVPMDALRAVAGDGSGRFAPVSADMGDLDVLLAEPLAVGSGNPADAHSSVDVDTWKDAGVYLLFVPLLLAPFAFRRGWLAVVLLTLSLSAPSVARAGVWDDLWQTRDQQAAEAFAAGDAARASELFESEDWRAAAAYESGDFGAATEQFAALEGVENRYNHGNALAKSGQLEEALAAYDDVLESAPEHVDAKFNRDLVEQLLNQQQQQQQQPSQSGESSDDESRQSDGGGDDSQAQDGQADASEQDGETSESQSSEQEQGEPNENASASDDESEGSEEAQQASSEADAGEPSSRDQDSQNAEVGDEESQDERRARGSEEDPQPSQEEYADRPEPETGPNSVPERMQEALDQAEAAEPTEEGNEIASAPAPEPMTEERQAREQMLRQIPDDPAGLLRAKIARTYAEKRFAEQQRRVAQQGGTNPWW